MVRVDELVRHRGLVHEHAQPTERIDAFEQADLLGRDAPAADAVEAVASRNVIAVEFMHLAVHRVADDRVALEPIERHVGGAVMGRGTGLAAERHEIAGHLGLAIDHHGPPGQRLEVDAERVAVEPELEPLMRQAFGAQALAGTVLLEQIDGALLEHTGADAAEHVFARLPLDDDIVDASPGQEMPQHQPGRAAADNRDLSAHQKCLSINRASSLQLPV